MACKVIGIDGRAGAGKSTLAARLAGLLSGAPVVHADDFATSEDQAPSSSRLLEQVLLPLSRNQAALYQRYDWDAQQLAEWHEIAVGEYLILEGVTVIQSEFRPYLALSVWVSTARKECFRRGVQRDGQDYLEEWHEWQDIEDRYIAREDPEGAADAVVSGENGQPWTGPGRPDKT